MNYELKHGGEQAGRLFNSEAGGHGRDARATTAQGRKKCAIPRNEPILFSRSFRCIDFRYRNLCRLQRRLQMGSFWKNEPILEGLLVETVLWNWLALSTGSERIRAMCCGGWLTCGKGFVTR